MVEASETIYLAGGCYWGVEEHFARMPGVTRTTVGFANGQTVAPTYRDVCTGTTGHAETVKVVFDPARVTLDELLDAFFSVVDPTSLNRQAGDVGTQYRSGIYYDNEVDEPIIRAAIARVAPRYEAPIVTEIEPLTCFFPAEEEHQRYLRKNPDGYCHIPL
jgi:peptide methionine sulfoxide reductase msrA/msrB